MLSRGLPIFYLLPLRPSKLQRFRIKRCIGYIDFDLTDIQSVFWAGVAFLIRLTVEAAELEQKAFANPFRYAVMIAALLIVWAGTRRHTTVEEKTSPTLRFEDLNPAEVISLNLHRD